MASSVFFTSSYTVFLNASVACSSPGSIIAAFCSTRSEEHTSELQSRLHLVCRLLLGTKDQTFELRTQLHLVPHHLPDTQNSTSRAHRVLEARRLLVAPLPTAHPSIFHRDPPQDAAAV